MDINTTTQIMARALISPFGELIISYKDALNLFIGFMRAKNDPGSAATLRVSTFLKINNKKGLRSASEITENRDDKILNPKYAATSFGYFEIYLKIDRKLFIYGLCPVVNGV